ncbi:hypothetical protein F5876DRAFT_42685 [Lentinula aff. lateritia]|uniref:Uncharacterized protein n=1 Tax=Lentinula aff. lateritia TaxID=2804960 RepID=A0ACC1TZL5_9AGAR|nr:hypothetical protein F5876DRAFT_42685 [Lentinula aff. lateritia]
MDSSLSLSTSCRILTLCSSLDRAVSFVQRLKLMQHDEQSTKDSFDEKAMPWTISNKYYSAQVHFLARTVKGLAPFHLKNVPAVIFIWEKGHAYKHHIQRICRDRDLNGSELEVSLAVRIHSHQDDERSSITAEDEEEEEFEGSGEIDEFLSSRGFEFIDVPASVDEDRLEDEGDLVEAIPSLPRVLDALSTIMWPSMQTSTKRQKHSQRKDDDSNALDWAQNSFDETDDPDFDVADDAYFVTAQTPVSRMAQQVRMKNEMEELRRWLEEDEREIRNDDLEDGGDSRNDPWGRAVSSTASQSAVMTMSPTSEEGGLSYSVPLKEDKFDDDFTVFVSAPAQNSFSSPSHPASTSHSKSHQDSISEGSFPSFASFGDSSFTAAYPFDDESSGLYGDTSFDSLAPPDQHSGIMYHSLGSASDLGDLPNEEAFPAHSSPHMQADNDHKAADDSDDGLPTQSEIRASAHRIFGTLSSPSSSSAKRLEGDAAEETNAKFDEFDDDMDFDLTHMVSAIQGMKAEISGMENEDDRRKAAAKVALGLVYGLDRRG